ncbi:hypothetical protein LCGC14_2901790, partial [marine sediment metagenome]
MNGRRSLGQRLFRPPVPKPIAGSAPESFFTHLLDTALADEIATAVVPASARQPVGRLARQIVPLHLALVHLAEQTDGMTGGPAV